ncbi:MAG: 4-hydroxythreonine-4-phosphate dehydrogenase PdxA [Proteobacteria bacterium]|nr:4-hydroxythreonine-4-phosphate dehydrogenase PdxA [Pseudomonadota bacterium]
MQLPLAITMGDGAGIGPEIIARYFGGSARDDLFVIGDPDRIAAHSGPHRIMPLAGEESLKDLPRIAREGMIPVLSAGKLPPTLPYGAIDARAGKLAYDSIIRAIDLALAGRIAGLVTAPIHKEALKAAGITFPGHTEILAARTGTQDFGMMLVEGPLRVILVSIHLSLREALDKVTGEALARTFRLAQEGCRALGIAQPRIAVAGLNPHAGEGGLFGREEIETIGPAIAKARTQGFEVSGPYPPDTVFMRARRGEFDIVVAQYHDQGLIPIKLNGIEKGVNITVGLPIIRTSVDHGTAFDIAGKGFADPSSLAEAVEVAHAMAQAKGLRRAD